ncbi:Nucleoside-diphosphate-sugar epimerase [Hymenobacter daecheongensis DSM 21074]|uniref:Nucleoside-diphosphate-sugar epimerase n=1 Tax=Hymenobacter daecheongensis DSM 21074 TaxID=1121955 RepID=A0A1M6HTZ2_9BACT|nr:SDR family oxidoreductase [Hymenobacter daecheongensis]SHJ25699.1 Nucleoside-diphosphate-sugar epimerase [Hymenobacter daecheongensis DSM 21074]
MTASAPASSASSPKLTVAVLGCGWLGLPLAKALVAAGYSVVGSTTTPSQLLVLRDAGITPYLLSLGTDFTPTDADTLRTMLTGVDVLVLNVPPRAAAANNYPGLLRPVGSAVAAMGVRHVVFVSSTSVYADGPRTMLEADAVSSPDAASDLLRAEGHFTPRRGQWLSTVVRFGGLIGPERPPGRFLAGRQNLPNADAPVNLIHLDDCIGVLTSIIREQAWGYTFNACASQHPSRQAFYTAAAQKLNLPPPTFDPRKNKRGKRIDSSLLQRTLAYQFRHDDLLAALDYC